MYLDHFKLSIKPFQITTDPKFLWLGEKHKEALATLRYGILDNRGFLLLTGEVGTGKTLLINRLVTMLELDTVVATLPDPDLNSMDFYNLLADGLKMNRTFDSKGAFLIHLRDFLHQSHANRKQVLLIIDESQRLHNALMEDIRVLSNIELHDRKLINIFFVGQQEFNSLLAAPQNRALAQRITVRYHISPLDSAEVDDYIRHRLKVAGTDKRIFTPAGVKEVFAFSGGIPRLINIICDHALLTAYARDTRLVDDAIVKECARELRIPLSSVGPASSGGERAPDTRSIAHAANKASTGQMQESGMAPAKEDPAPAASGPQVARKQRSPIWFVFYAAVVLLMVVAAAYVITRFTDDERSRWDAEELTPQKYRTSLERERELLAQRMESGEAEPTTPESSPPPIAADIPPLPPVPVLADDEATYASLIGETITIRFALNSNEIDDEAYAVLDRIAALLERHPRQTAHVHGYTDASGSAGYNESVSRFRANAVKSYLVGKGAPAERVEIFAMGAANPIATNDTAEGRSLNRRVEIQLPSE